MLMRYLITLGSRRGDIVIDPYLGSGTTSLAALELGRKYIGIEMTEEYYKIASQKLKISDIGIEDSLNEDMFV